MSALRRRVGCLKQALQRVPQEMQREFFFDVLGRPQGTDPLLHLSSPGSRQNDHRHYGIETADLSQDGEPIHPRHFEIEHKDIGAFSAKALQTLLATFRDDHVIALPPEERVKESTDALLIINHEDLGHTSPRIE